MVPLLMIASLIVVGAFIFNSDDVASKVVGVVMLLFFWSFAIGYRKIFNKYKIKK